MRAAVVIGAGLLVLAPDAARAEDWYDGVGMGPGASLHGDLDAHFDTEGQVAGRVVLGRRMGPWAVEGVFFGTDLSSTGQEATHSTLSLGVDVLRLVPLGRNLDIYARGGLSYTWLVLCPDHEVVPPGPNGYSGRGLQYGFGARWTARTTSPDGRFVLYGSLTADVNRQHVRLERDGAKGAMVTTLDMVTFGFLTGLAW